MNKSKKRKMESKFSLPLKGTLIDEPQLYDSPEFRFILKTLIEDGFVIRKDITRIQNLIFDYTSVYWRASDRAFTMEIPKKNQIFGHSVIHHGIHYLITKRFGSKLKGMPLFTLLSESIASGSELYFTIAYFQKSGIEHPYVERFVSGLSQLMQNNQIPFMSRFNQCQKKPFEAYKAAVLELFDFSLYLLDQAKKRDSRYFESPDDFERKIRSMKYFCLFTNLRYPAFVLYTLSFCGPRSSKADIKTTDECIKLLKTSKSMEQFLARLGTLPV